MQAPAQFSIGIDLGTTHCALSYVDKSASDGDHLVQHVLAIPQLTAPASIEARPLLPSFLYLPHESELSAADMALPWGAQQDFVVGEFARSRGAATPIRLVSSAKSWLCHPGVDRRSPLLPADAPAEVHRVSPLTASIRYLSHLRWAWEQAHPEAPFDAQDITVTIPASFDPAARELTAEACKAAGFQKLSLLEEPQAALYSWIQASGGGWRKQVQSGDVILVVDVGGGTTDLSLIAVLERDGNLALQRVAVGEHILLGGDNMDLALAHQLEPQFAPEGQRLPAARFAQLVQRCRIAKEQLLAADAPEQVAVTLLGGGSRLLAQSKTASLSRAQVQQWVVEGFLPLAERSAVPSKRQGALRGFGLPYPADAAITRHLAQFLAQHAGNGGAQALPDTVLLNGGVFHAHAVVERLTQQLSAWRGTPVRVLHNPHPDWAVARGAAAYGLTRFAPEAEPAAALPATTDAAAPPVAPLRSRLPQIGGGSARSYWLLLPGAKGAAPQGLCLLPRGTQEGVRMVLSGRRFALKLGQAVRFDLLANSLPSLPAQAGQLAPLQGDGWVELPPLAAVLPAPEGQHQAQIEVQLQASMTEVGTLEVRCVAVDDPSQSWLLPLSLRGTVQAADDSAATADSAGEAHASARREQAIAQIDRIFGNQAQAVDAKEVRQLRQVLERLLGPRNSWDLALLRAMFDALLARAKRRRRTPEHERAWLNLAGWCLRPGLGAQLDAWRVEQVWALYPQGLGHGKEPGNWTEWWVFWRRVAAGLNEAQQMELLEDVAGHMQKAVQQTARKRADGSGGKSSHGSYDDMLRLFAAMEAVPWQYRQEMGQWMLQRLKREGETVQTWWAIGRLAARQPMAANAHLVMPPDAAQEFVQATLAQDWRRNETAMFAALQMARMTGDRARDLPDALRSAVLDKMRSSGAPERWIAMVSQVVEMDAEDQQRSLGDSLPPGLALL